MLILKNLINYEIMEEIMKINCCAEQIRTAFRKVEHFKRVRLTIEVVMTLDFKKFGRKIEKLYIKLTIKLHNKLQLDQEQRYLKSILNNEKIISSLKKPNASYKTIRRNFNKSVPLMKHPYTENTSLLHSTKFNRKKENLSQTFHNDTVLSPLSSSPIKSFQIILTTTNYLKTLSIDFNHSNILPNEIPSNIKTIWMSERVDKIDARAQTNKQLFLIDQATKELSVLLLRSLGHYKQAYFDRLFAYKFENPSRCTQFSEAQRAFSIRTIGPKLDIPLEHWDRPCSDNSRCRSESPALAPIKITNGFRCIAQRSEPINQSNQQRKTELPKLDLIEITSKDIDN
jgi:hypothetical protein